MLSPHFDDVPLSLGQSLRTGVLRSADVRVRVVFGHTNWTTWVHPSPERAAAISWWRTAEEELAARTFGYRVTRARWEEALLRRGLANAGDLLSGELGADDEALLTEIRRWLLRVIVAQGRDRPDLVLAPAGLGGHVDHVILATAAAQVCGTVPTPVGFYEDRPYVSHLPDEVVTSHLEALVPGLERRSMSPPITVGTQRLAHICYPSQMTPYFSEAMDADRATGADEGAWFPLGTAPDWLPARG